MKRNWKIRLLIFAYCLMLLVIFILPMKSVSGYSIIRNTPSELGAQFTPNAWIMNSTLVFLASAAMNAGWKFLRGYNLHRIFLALFTISLISLAYFNHAPINTSIQFNLFENGLHTYFLGTTGLSFILLSIASAFNLDKQIERKLAIAAGTSIIFLSVLMSEADQLAGIWQRLQFMISFGWLIFIFRSEEL